MLLVLILVIVAKQPKGVQPNAKVQPNAEQPSVKVLPSAEQPEGLTSQGVTPEGLTSQGEGALEGQALQQFNREWMLLIRSMEFYLMEHLILLFQITR